MNRRSARKKAVQSLFQIDISDITPTEAIQHLLTENEPVDPFLETLVNGTLEHIEEVDPLIEKQLEHWRMQRINNVDRQILRMAVYEIFYIEDIPRNVTFDEAVELAKLFGGEESGGFVNGVLSNIAPHSDQGGKG